MAICSLDGQIRRTGRNVQKPISVEESHFTDGEATPNDVPAEAEEMVQKIVPPGDGGKDLPDHADMLVTAEAVHCGIAFPLRILLCIHVHR